MARRDQSLVVLPSPPTETSRPLRVVARLRNNRLILAREALGFASTQAAAKALRLPYHSLVDYEGLRRKPVHAEGAWRKDALEIATAYRTTPEVLWPESLSAVTGTTSVLEIDVPPQALEAPPTPEELVEEGEVYLLAEEAIDSLGARWSRILRWHFGLGGEAALSDSEIGERIHLSHTRVAQIREQAMRELRKRLAVAGLPVPKK